MLAFECGNCVLLEKEDFTHHQHDITLLNPLPKARRSSAAPKDPQAPRPLVITIQQRRSTSQRQILLELFWLPPPARRRTQQQRSQQKVC